MVSEKKIKKRIIELVNEIKKHNEEYYDKDSSLISDFEYDSLVKELEYLQEHYPSLMPDDSPLQKVGGKVSASFQKVSHRVPMLSLSNSYSKQEIIEFDSKVKKTLSKEINDNQELLYCCELKVDGLAVSLIYKDGKFKQGITRGDGRTGEDVTENIMEIKEIPKEIPCRKYAEIRGEVFLKKDRLILINEQRKLDGEAVFSNVRNAAAGTIRQLESKIVRERSLNFYPYFLVDAKSHGISKHSQIFDWLKQQGFIVSDNYLQDADINQVIDFCSEWEMKRDSLDFEFDGVVVKVEDLLFQELLGFTMKTPRWAVAYKFSEEVADTVLIDVLFQVGRLGTITPVAVLKPVEISGAIVERATLHNIDFIREKGVAINDEVVVKRAAEVIPAVVMVSHRSKDRKEILFPTNCPICGTLLKQAEEDVAIYCPNLNCKGRLKSQLKHVVSRDAFNISGIGDRLIEILVEKEIIKDWIQIFDLDKESLINIERMGDKSVTNILFELEKVKNVGLAKIIFAIGIKHVGSRASELLASTVNSYQDLFQMEIDEFAKIEGIGNKTALFLKDFFKSERAEQIFSYFQRKGFILSTNKNYKGNQLLGKKFVITGSFTKYSRHELSDLIKAHQGSVSGSVSKNIDYVLVGDNPGSKLEKAQTLGIKTISEQDLTEMLN